LEKKRKITMWRFANCKGSPPIIFLGVKAPELGIISEKYIVFATPP
jgi:hypothetical protein